VSRFPLITLVDSAANSTASVAPDRGAIVTSFTVGGSELLYLDQATFEDPAKNVRGGVPILFPSPGKLANDAWEQRGHKGSMKQHGFARTRAWQVLSSSSRQVALQLRSDAATLEQYPWPFIATLELELNAMRLRFKMSIENTGREAMPFGLGYHPYFRVTDKARARIDTDATRQFDNLSKSVSPFAGFDLTAGEVDLHMLDQRARHMPLHLGDGSTIDVSASDDFAHWVVWTLNTSDFVCVEPWTCAGNALNTGEQLLILEPGKTHRSLMDISFRG
jgi:galactose mutarotase-like enzyme